MEKTLQFGNEGKRLVPGETENLSSSHHEQGDAARPHDKLDQETERGQRAGFDPDTGAVSGSGANAGGGGAGGEDYDQDSAGGGAKPDVSPGASR
jgi:hypothetical protein